MFHQLGGTNKEDERDMTNTVRSKQMCEEVHYTVECMDAATCKHELQDRETSQHRAPELRDSPACQPMSKIKPSTVRDNAHRQECEQVDEEVHYMLKCRGTAGQECKHMPMDHWSDMVHGFKLLDWEDKVTKWDEWTDAMTLICLQEVDRASRKGHPEQGRHVRAP